MMCDEYKINAILGLSNIHIICTKVNKYIGEILHNMGIFVHEFQIVISVITYNDLLAVIRLSLLSVA